MQVHRVSALLPPTDLGIPTTRKGGGGAPLARVRTAKFCFTETWQRQQLLRANIFRFRLYAIINFLQ